MKLEKELTTAENKTTLNVKVEGRLDTTTAPELEAALISSLTGVNTLVLDFAELAYISSAGLRVLLQAQKIMSKQGSMKVCHSNEEIKEVFDVTGFADILTLEP